MSEGGQRPSVAGPEELRVLLEQAGDWYWEADTAMRLTAIRVTRRDPPAIAFTPWLGKCDWEIEGQLLCPASWAEHRARLTAHRPFSDLVVCRPGADARQVVMQLCGAPVLDADGRFAGYVGIGRDVSELHEANAAVRRFVDTDAQTGLPNARAFDALAQAALAGAFARGRSCALLNIGLDRIEALYSMYGHRVRDAMLAAVALRLRAALGGSAVLGRRDGDAIVALVLDAGDAAAAQECARRAVDALRQTERIENIDIHVTAPAGVAMYPRDGGELDALLDAAAAALALARQAGEGRVAAYSPALSRRHDLRQRMEERLRMADPSRDFRLVYQPLVKLPGGELAGAEVLLRWTDVELGDIDPGEFIPIAEECGLIDGLGDWVLREVCRQRQLWRGVGLELPPVAINVSGVQLRDKHLVDRILTTLDEFELSAAELEVEITETGIVDCMEEAREVLLRLRSAGIKTALDDFGVGYSNLVHLRDLPMHRLKIDRSFTMECMRDARTLTIVKSVIEMAHNLGLIVTAEGVETADQQSWMHHLGCDSAQGFHFARPMPAEDFLRAFLAGSTRRAGATRAVPLQ